MKIAKRCKKTFRRATKAVGMNYFERRRAAKAVKAFSYDVAVNVASTVCVDIIYTAVDVTTTGVVAVANKISEVVTSKNPTNIEEDLVVITEESEA